jgi:hypothetical protein
MIVGPEGEIIEICHFSQTATRSPDGVRLRSVEAAADDLRKGRGMPPSGLTEANCSKVTVERAQLGYYAAPVPMNVSEYLPVYLLRVRLADGSLGEWVVSAYSEGSLPVFGE